MLQNIVIWVLSLLKLYNFDSAIDNLYKKSLKALFKLLHILKPFPTAKTMFHLFDHLIKPIILYFCEIWELAKFIYTHLAMMITTGSKYELISL